MRMWVKGVEPTGSYTSRPLITANILCWPPARDICFGAARMSVVRGRPRMRWLSSSYGKGLRPGRVGGNPPGGNRMRGGLHGKHG